MAEIKGYYEELDPAEVEFFTHLIEKYLKPLKPTEKEQDTVMGNLLKLRNSMATAFFMLNALFTVLIFVMQRNVDEVGTRPWVDREAIMSSLNP